MWTYELVGFSFASRVGSWCIHNDKGECVAQVTTRREARAVTSAVNTALRQLRKYGANWAS